jgi:hypothetical protein
LKNCTHNQRRALRDLARRPYRLTSSIVTEINPDVLQFQVMGSMQNLRAFVPQGLGLLFWAHLIEKCKPS